MGFFRRRHYDRNRILADATRAEKQGKTARAAALYRQVLEAEPNNYEIHSRVAPLLLERGDDRAAWQSYKHAIEHLIRNRQFEAAVAQLREASKGMPEQAGVWATLAAVELKRGSESAAYEALLSGRAQLRRRRDRLQAIELLERARKLRPNDLDVAIDLARLLAGARRRKHALQLLDRLEQQQRNAAEARRLRAIAFRISPTPVRAWRLIRNSPTRPKLVSAPG